MRRSSLAVAALALGLGSCASPESLYLTTSAPLAYDEYGTGPSGYTFIAPYFAEVQTQISVAMSIAPTKSGDAPSPPTLTVTATPVPRTRGYLYLRQNAFFSDSVNVGVGTDGLLTSSDSSSVQQVTAILTELAQTVAPFVSVEFNKSNPPAPAKPTDDRTTCNQAITDLLKNAPYNLTYPPFENMPAGSNIFWVYPSHAPKKPDEKTAQIKLRIAPSVASLGEERIGGEHAGLIAFFPVPATAQLFCTVGTDSTPVLLTGPIPLSLYSESHFVDPKRDFFTNPQDTYTFSAGFITGHKYSDQSAAKTVVDTATAPIRAIMPSVSVEQQNQVQTGGGKPDQTTTTTTTTTKPSGS